MATKLRSILKGQKGAVTRIVSKFEVIKEEETNYDDLQTIENSLKAKLQMITGIHEKIIEIIPDDNADEIEQEILEQEEYVFELQSKIQKVSNFRKVKFSNLNVNSQVFPNPVPESADAIQFIEDEADYSTSQSFTPPTPSHSSIHHRLPKLDLPKFDGDILEWQSFWDSYESAIHSNTSLTSVQKFNYLKSCLRSEALQTVAGFSLTNANYERAVSLLQERYGQKDRIIQTYMTALLEIPAPIYTLPSVRKFYDTTITYIRALESLNQSESTYGSLLVPVILQKLPSEIRQNLAREHGTQSWQLSELMKGLMREISILDAGSLLDSVHGFTATATTASFLTKSEKKVPEKTESTNYKHTTNRLERTACVFCKGQHSSTECRKVTDHSKRLEIVKRNQLCFNCLGSHKIADCKSKFKCKACSRRHHTSLCTGLASKSAASIEGETKHNAKDNHTSVLHSAHTFQAGRVLLKTAVAMVTSGGTSCSANILFDEGSQSSFITEKMAKQLELKPTGKETLCLSGFGDKERRLRHLETSVLYVQTTREKIPVKVMVVPEISVPLKTYQKEVKHLGYLKNLKLAHPVTENENFEIEILVGADFYWQFIQNKVVRGNGPTAVQSKLGYLLSGPLSTHTVTAGNQTSLPVSMMNVITMHDENELDIERFWKVEELGVQPKSDLPDYDQYLKRYQDACISYDNGQYTAKLPWRDEHDILPTNENISFRRTISVINRLKKEPGMLKKYGEIIGDQEQRGFIEKVPEDQIQTDKQIHYIPHHPVKKDSATTPIRIVYDCSCRSARGTPSLNECLMNTPPLLNDLTSILLQFRTHKYAISTDIEKAFLNVGLHSNDRDVTRFFWLSDPNNPYSQLQTYRFKSVLFGATCSPFILNATILKHLETFPCKETELIKKGLYVDNILTSVPDENTLFEFFNESREIFKKGAFTLRSWSSNSEPLRDTFASAGVADNDQVTKVLGMRWDPQTDILSFSHPVSDVNDSLLTKREILKQSSAIFDPLGLLSPVTVRSKIFIQSLWQRQLDWDEKLPDDITTEWCKIRSDVIKVTETKVCRCFIPESTSADRTLHVFTDASSKAYGACAYLVSNKRSTLVMSKNKVAPLKQLTIPKLELCAALLGSRLCQHITSTIHCSNVVLWSDSQIVLQWIASDKKQNVFIQNRVQEIRKHTNHFQWRYCPTTSNPADLLSRGISFLKFNNSNLWQRGPEWLTKEKALPVNSLPDVTDNSAEEVAVLLTETDNTLYTPGILNVIDLQRFSSYQKALRTCAYVFRFINCCKRKQTKRQCLQPQELDNAAKCMIRHTQAIQFKSILQYLDGRRIPKPSLISQLDLYLDEDSILRCGGRIVNAPLPGNARFPYILSAKGRLTELVIMDAHKASLHSGVESTVTFLRQRFWIPGIRNRVKTVIRKCVVCRKVTGPPYEVPDPPPLPKDRLKTDSPFTVTGVDFSGALNVKTTDGQIKKVYICLFTCASTRAVHLEVVNNMTTDAFILAVRRFFSKRSTPKVFMSDNALTFIATSKILTEELTKHGITWKFIPQHAPWYGGWWERLIGLTKNCIKKVLGKSLVSLEVLQTIVAEVECIINDRPLTHLSSDPLDEEPLTPSHLLYGRRISTPVYPDDRDINVADDMTHASADKLYRFKSSVIERFWSRWKHEYVTSLREFHRKSGHNGDEVRIGDVVQIKEDNLPRGRWSLGVINDVVVGGDGRIRAARVKSKRGITTRPIAKLFPLEIID